MKEACDRSPGEAGDFCKMPQGGARAEAGEKAKACPGKEQISVEGALGGQKRRRKIRVSKLCLAMQKGSDFGGGTRGAAESRE